MGNYPKTGIKKKVQTQIINLEVPQGHVLCPVGNFRQSAYLQETSLYLGQSHTFLESEKLLEKFCGISLSDKQIEHLSHHYGECLEVEIKEQGVGLQAASKERHYAMLDGSYILSREQGWIETKLGRVFKGSSHVALSATRGEIQESSYVAHVGKHDEFLDKFEGLLQGLQEVVFIADGAQWIWKWVEDNYCDSVQILDFFHAYEKIGEFAVLAIKEEGFCKAWCEQAKELLLSNELEEVMEQIQQMEGSKQVMAKRDALLGYLKRNAHRMQYQTFLAKGYFIGSGAIESAQRTVIQHRLKRSGQRWTIKGAQQVLNLRTMNFSGKWHKVTDLIRRAA